jgi:hypothetical protein
MKGQGSVEYIEILVAILIVALVVVVLIGFYPSIGSSGRITQSTTYWSGAQPFSIVLSKINGTTVQLVVANRGSANLVMTNISFSGQTINASNITFKPGEEKTVNGTLQAVCGT